MFRSSDQQNKTSPNPSGRQQILEASSKSTNCLCRKLTVLPVERCPGEIRSHVTAVLCTEPRQNELASDHNWDLSISSAAEQRDPPLASGSRVKLCKSQSYLHSINASSQSWRQRDSLELSAGRWSLDLVKKTSSTLLQTSETPENVLFKHSCLK